MASEPPPSSLVQPPALVAYDDAVALPEYEPFIYELAWDELYG